MNPFSSNVSKFFTGSPTDETVWMLIGNPTAAGIGLTTTSFRTAKRHAL